jgi:type VI secretion system ImpA family protein
MIDIDAILMPVPGADPGGPDLRYDPVFDRIKELRREDDARASRGIWLTKLKVADYGAVIDLCSEVLARRSKDLQLACWLADAMVARDGLAGIPPGLHFIGILTDAFWPVLWPRSTPDDDEDPRQAAFAWLDAHLAERTMRTPIGDYGGVEVTWQDHISAQLRPASERKRSTEADPPELDNAAIEAVIDRTGDPLYVLLAQTVAVGLAALERLKTQLDRHYDGQGPSFGRTVAVLAAIAAFLRPRLLRRGIDAATGPEPDRVTLARGNKETKPMRETTPDDAAIILAGPIRSREEAYRALEAVARFLEQTEPHSPVPLLVRRAIIWGRMPLAALLQELMRDQNLLNRLLGLDEDGSTPLRATR